MTRAEKRQFDAMVVLCGAIRDTVQQLVEVPSGHVYAHVMKVANLDAYEQCIRILTRTGLIRQDNSFVLHWTGPAKEATL